MKDEGLTPETRGFFNRIRRNEDIDSKTFLIWKNELKKDLPIFWESLRDSKHSILKK